MFATFFCVRTIFKIFFDHSLHPWCKIGNFLKVSLHKSHHFHWLEFFTEFFKQEFVIVCTLIRILKFLTLGLLYLGLLSLLLLPIWILYLSLLSCWEVNRTSTFNEWFKNRIKWFRLNSDHSGIRAYFNVFIEVGNRTGRFWKLFKCGSKNNCHLAGLKSVFRISYKAFTLK